jgi:imipenem/basic amino acid-specific outer membrane pore
MKLAKLSLAAMVVAGLASSSFAADTLADAFKNGKVSGELKAWYFDQTADQVKNGHANNSNITTLGLTLGYVTDSFYGFSLGTTFQGAGNADSAEKNAKSTFKNDEYTGGGVLSEAYIAYTLSKTTVKVGRQFIATPLVSGSGSRIFTEAFEGAVIINTDLPQTTLIGGYVDRFQGRTSSVSKDAAAGVAYTADGGTANGDAPTFEKSAAFTGGAAGGLVASFDGAYTLGVINSSITNLKLIGQYAIVKDVATVADVDVYYTEANYVLPVAGFKLGFDANFRGSKTDTALDAANLEGTYTAGRISISELAGFGASFAYGTVSKNDAVIMGMGNGPTSYTSTMIRGTSTRTLADTDSYLFAASYDFSKLGVAGLTVLAQYGWTKQGDNATNLATGSTAAGSSGLAGRESVVSADYTNIAVGVTYAVPAVKGLTTSLQYETQERELNAGGTGFSKGATIDTSELWFKAGYKF